MQHLITLALVGLMTACAAAPDLVQDDPYPQDGNITAAVSIEIDHPIADRLGPSSLDATDWKTFAVRRASTLRIRFRSAGPLRLIVYGDDGATVGSLAGHGGREQVFVAKLKPGQYLMEVTATSTDLAIDYLLTLESTP